MATQVEAQIAGNVWKIEKAVGESVAKPLLYYQNNVGGTANVTFTAVNGTTFAAAQAVTVTGTIESPTRIRAMTPTANALATVETVVSASRMGRAIPSATRRRRLKCTGR